MLPFQTPNQVVDVSAWEKVDGYGVYPEGSREKRLLRCPLRAPYPFLKPGRKYLLKYSRDRYPAQYWCEILAYRIGTQLGLDVPPAHVAVDENGRSAALIEWFLEEEKGETRFSGGDYLVGLEPGFDRKKGYAHSWMLVKELLGSLGDGLMDWKSRWFDMMLFDALIGNTDRHQENWAFIREPERRARLGGFEPADHYGTWNGGWSGNSFGGSTFDEPYFVTSGWSHPLWGRLRFGPLFDNGTSLGHELPEEKVAAITEEELLRYIRKGVAHLRWDGPGNKGIRHFDLIDRILAEDTRRLFLFNKYADLQPAEVRQMTTDLCAFNVPVPLSADRGEFMARLVALRRQELLSRLHASP